MYDTVQLSRTIKSSRLYNHLCNPSNVPINRHDTHTFQKNHLALNIVYTFSSQLMHMYTRRVTFVPCESKTSMTESVLKCIKIISSGGQEKL